MFVWFDNLGISSNISILREQFPSVFLPDFVIYSLSNSLWVLSGVLALSVIWHEDRKEKLIWTILFLGITFLSEFAQLIEIIPGKKSQVFSNASAKAS